MLNEPKVINVLGANIQILFRKEKDDPKLENCVGYFDSSESLVVIRVLEADKNSLGNLDRYQKEILRHEILHAFLYESGLDGNTGCATNWAVNEEMVDWFAIQSPKIYKVFKELELI